VKKPKLRELKEAIRAIFRGPYTTKFPFEPHEPPEGFRGRSEFQQTGPTGVGCVGCKACAEVCPAIAIEVVDDVDANPPVRRLTIHHDKCIFCGQCELNCTTGEGVKLTKQYDMVTFDRSTACDSIEHELVLCQSCGTVIGTRKHLIWLAEKLGAKAYANPTLILTADGSAKLAEPFATGVEEPLARNELMRVLCPACRRTVVIREIWGR